MSPKPKTPRKPEPERAKSKGGNEPKYETHALLRFLKKIDVANTYHPESKHVRKKVRWRLTKSTYNLWGEVIGDE